MINNEGFGIEVIIDYDIPENVRVRTQNKKSEEWYGPIDFGLTIDEAMGLAKALELQIAAMMEMA